MGMVSARCPSDRLSVPPSHSSTTMVPAGEGGAGSSATIAPAVNSGNNSAH